MRNCDNTIWPIVSRMAGVKPQAQRLTFLVDLLYGTFQQVDAEFSGQVEVSVTVGLLYATRDQTPDGNHRLGERGGHFT
jgi:hypothetical protein